MPRRPRLLTPCCLRRPLLAPPHASRLAPPPPCPHARPACPPRLMLLPHVCVPRPDASRALPHRFSYPFPSPSPASRCAPPARCKTRATPCRRPENSSPVGQAHQPHPKPSRMPHPVYHAACRLFTCTDACSPAHDDRYAHLFSQALSSSRHALAAQSLAHAYLSARPVSVGPAPLLSRPFRCGVIKSPCRRGLTAQPLSCLPACLPLSSAQLAFPCKLGSNLLGSLQGGRLGARTRSTATGRPPHSAAGRRRSRQSGGALPAAPVSSCAAIRIAAAFCGACSLGLGEQQQGARR